MVYQTVIFDLDGTLLDTLEDLTDSTNQTLREQGFPQRRQEEIQSFLGNGARYLIQNALPEAVQGQEELVSRCVARFQEIYRGILPGKAKVYPGIMELLAALKTAGVRTAVLSNKPDFAVKALCKILFGELLTMAEGERDGLPRKPAPEHLWQMMEQLTGSCLYVGDSEVDVATAGNAKVPCAAVTWGFRERDMLAGADYFVDTPEQLLKICLGEAL